MQRRIIASLFIIIGLIFGAIFYLNIDKPLDFIGYFQKPYYSQFGPFAISLELIFAGYALLKKLDKSYFTLAIFGFTVLSDFLLSLSGIFISGLPIYATIVFLVCTAISFWIIVAKKFDLEPMSWFKTVLSFVLGALVELFFNYL